MTKRYSVELTDTAATAILIHARYIAEHRREPLNAERWLESVWDAVDSLECMPRRCAVAEEDEYLDYEVRAILAGSVSLLLTIDDELEIVWIVAVRGEGQLPRPEQLPSSLDVLRGRE